MNKALFKPHLPAETTFKEALKTNAGWLGMKKLDPKTETAKTFYLEKGKACKEAVELGNKTALLEREAWTDKIFTGDNVQFTAQLVSEAEDREKILKRGARKGL